MNMVEKISKYLSDWKKRDYDKIPDEVPNEIMKRNLAPSYKAIALAILKNDHNLTSLGFSGKKSKWYSVFKKIEIEERNKKKQN